MIYEYTRDKIDNLYNINNPERLDGEGDQIYLANEIKDVLTDKIFKVNCNSIFCYIDFEGELTEGEKAQLDTIVSDHKNNL